MVSVILQNLLIPTSIAHAVSMKNGRRRRIRMRSIDLDHLRIALPEAEFVASDGDLYRISEGGHLADIALASLGDAHVHDVPLEGSFSVQLHYLHGVAALD